MTDSPRLTDAELKQRMADYNRMVLDKIWDLATRKAPVPRMSAEDIDREYVAIARFKLARSVFEETLRDGVLPITSLRADRIQDILDMLEDASPNIGGWEEAISEAKSET